MNVTETAYQIGTLSGFATRFLDVTELVKGPGSLSRELARIHDRYPEIFTKERNRVRELYGDGNPNWIPTFAVRFRDRAGIQRAW